MGRPPSRRVESRGKKHARSLAPFGNRPPGVGPLPDDDESLDGYSANDIHQGGMADAIIDRHRKRLRGKARRITIDFVSMDDPTHGDQQLTFFHGHYDTWCYLPLFGFLTFNDEAEQYLFAAVLRPGNASAKDGTIGILRRAIERLRAAFPRARIRVRMDGGFAGPRMFEYLESEGVEFAVGVGGNPVLERRARRLVARAGRASRESGESEREWGECMYAAKTWRKKKRRVVIKAEVVRHEGRAARENPRFVVTNMTQSARWVYENFYCARGEVENRLQELRHGMEIDRTSCTRFWANQLRVLLTATAYALLQEIRLRVARTEMGRAQVATIRDRLIKIGVRVVESVRRYVFLLPRSYSHITEWRSLAMSFADTT